MGSKVSNIKKEGNLYIVTVTPSKLGQLFGKKEKTYRLKSTWSYYTFGGQNIYVYEDGTRTPNGDKIAEAIDKFNRKF